MEPDTTRHDELMAEPIDRDALRRAREGGLTNLAESLGRHRMARKLEGWNRKPRALVGAALRGL